MRPTQRFREWDRAVLPGAAARVRVAADRWQARRARWAAAREGVDWLSPRDLDRRFGDLRPLALVRDLPQVGFIAIAVVLLAGAVTAVTRYEPGPAPPDVQDVTAVPPSQGPERLGPVEGTTAGEYVRAADASVAKAAAGDPATRATALVTLQGYRVAADLPAVLQGVRVRRVYLRSPAGGRYASIFPVEVGTDLLGGLRSGYQQAARNRRVAVTSYVTLVKTSVADKAYQALYEELLVGARAEAAAYASGCACAFAALVEGTASSLVAVRARPGVRAVEVARAVAEAGAVVVTYLFPEVRGRIERITPAGDPSR